MLLSPRCPTCRARHRPDLPHWWGRYATEMSRLTLATHAPVCHMCGEFADTADHVTPRSLGGGDDPENLLPACRSCNSRRGNDPNPHKPDEPVTPAGVGLTERWRA